MVRKSERNKPKGVEKVEAALPEKTPRKCGRPPKRKKKSESDSEAEPEPETKEVGEIPELKPSESDVPSAEAAAGKGGSRRSARKTRISESTDNPEPETVTAKPEKNSEWKEDPTFWGPEDSAPVVDSSKSEEATTWKIQSSNGSGGEIQKLKICRQRVANDSNDSSSPAQVKDSPRRKKKGKHADESAESGGDVSSSNEAKEESKPEVTETAITPGSEEEADSGVVTELPNPPQETEKDKDNSEEAPAVTAPIEPLDIPIPQDSVEDVIKVVDEVEIETSSRRGSQEDKESSQSKSRKSSTEETESVESKPAAPASTGDAPHAEKPATEADSSIINKETSEEKSAEEQASTAVETVSESTAAVESSVNEPTTDTVAVKETNDDEQKQPRVRTKSEASDDGKGEKKLLSKVKVTVNSEDAMDEIAKKLNERAARFSKDESKEKRRESRTSTDSVGARSPREEGELTPTPEVKRIKHTTIIINKPKEVSSQPTKLKRNTDELPPTERKRRILQKSKSRDKEEDPINISSQSLMLLVPEVKTITPEQVAAFPLEDEELTRYEMDDQSGEETVEKPAKKKIDLKPKEVEIRVENDTRQVSKKRQIVIYTKNSSESKSVGPKLPNQENNRVVRKISIVNEEVKKVQRSPSPGGKNQTEVLFITNLVRPFTVPQLRELLARTGTIAPNGFYIDKIKSKCYVKYTDVEMAVETRHALNGVRWPVNNPKTLKVEFVPPEEMTMVQQLAEDETAAKKIEAAPEHVVGSGGWLSEQAALKPQRRVTTAVREWDMGKIGAGPLEEKRPVDDWRGGAKQQEQGEQKRRPPSPVETKYEPPARKIKKRDSDAPARLLDDLFRKTKATPCIYWLPLTAAQIAVKEEMRRQHMAENERRLAELRKTDHSRRDNRDRDREKSRDRRKK